MRNIVKNCYLSSALIGYFYSSKSMSILLLLFSHWGFCVCCYLSLVLGIDLRYLSIYPSINLFIYQSYFLCIYNIYLTCRLWVFCIVCYLSLSLGIDLIYLSICLFLYSSILIFKIINLPFILNNESINIYQYNYQLLHNVFHLFYKTFCLLTFLLKNL